MNEARVSRAFCATMHVDANDQSSRPWNELKAIVDKVHHHVCGNSNYEDIKVLLSRNELWNPDVKKYLAHLLDCCPDCTAVQAPKEQRPVSLSSMSREFNDVVCVDHSFLDTEKVFYITDSSSRYSAGGHVTDMGMQASIIALEKL